MSGGGLRLFFGGRQLAGPGQLGELPGKLPQAYGAAGAVAEVDAEGEGHSAFGRLQPGNGGVGHLPHIVGNSLVVLEAGDGRFACVGLVNEVAGDDIVGVFIVRFHEPLRTGFEAHHHYIPPGKKPFAG